MPTQEQWGRKIDLPGAIQAKMEAAFGADFSGLELYESPTVAESGASAMTMGHKVGFAPGKLDFTSSSGQALLGHELSHVVSQARGEVSGSGFLADASLEARADREGALAAAGETVYSGPVAPLSPVASSAALAEAGPMQAAGKPWKKKEDKNAISEPTPVQMPTSVPAPRTDTSSSGLNLIFEEALANFEKENGDLPFEEKMMKKQEFHKDMMKRLETVPEEVIRNDKAFQQSVLKDSVSGAHGFLQQLSGNPSADYGEISNKAFRGAEGNRTQQLFQFMLRKMVGEKDIQDAFANGDTDAGFTVVSQRAEDSGALDLLSQYQDELFEGIDLPQLNEDQQSRMIMQNFNTRGVMPAVTRLTPDMSEEEKNSRKALARKAQSGVAVNPSTGADVEGHTTEAGSRFLNLLGNKRKQRT